MTHPIPGDRVCYLGSYGTVTDMISVGFTSWLAMVDFDAHWPPMLVSPADLERVFERLPFRPQLAFRDGVDVRETAPSECTP